MTTGKVQPLSGCHDCHEAGTLRFGSPYSLYSFNYLFYRVIPSVGPWKPIYHYKLSDYSQNILLIRFDKLSIRTTSSHRSLWWYLPRYLSWSLWRASGRHGYMICHFWYPINPLKTYPWNKNWEIYPLPPCINDKTSFDVCTLPRWRDWRARPPFRIYRSFLLPRRNLSPYGIPNPSHRRFLP